MKFNKFIPILILVLTLLACKDSPKVITAEADVNITQPESSGIFSEESNASEPMNTSKGGFTENLHTVIANKVLPTSKYVYVNVTEGRKQFWIATGKVDVIVGNTYFYRDGLLKTDFESKDYKRIFDTIYLVSSIVPKDHGEHSGGLKADFMEEEPIKRTESVSKKETIPMHTEDIITHKGSIKIAELVSNLSKYEGKTIQISGKVVKVNPNIMNRNWLHLQDGSKNDYDLVATSNTFVPEGKSISIRAKVSIDRNFGAGYRYDLILEDGVIVE